MIQKITGEKINTLQELLSVVKPDFNSYSYSGSRITISGEVLFNGKKVQAYRHWSHAGNIGLYEGDSNHRIAEIQNANEWFPYVVDGIEQVDDLGRTICDCNIVPVGNRTKCYSVRLESLVSISDKAYRATAFDGSTAIIPKSQVFGDDNEVQKSEAYWIAAFILEKEGCSLQYSTKKVKWFNK